MSTHRIRIVQKGWETFTGNFGSVEFVQGLSTTLCTEAEVDRIASHITVVCADDGYQLGASARMILSKCVPMPVLAASPTAPEKTDEPEVEKFYSEEELGRVVDSGGLGALREVAASFGVRGRSIPELIANILKAQSAKRSQMLAASIAQG